jgi:hypothetical protein
MAIFSVSDIIITATLVVNALALISSKLPRLHHLQIPSGGHEDEKKLHNNFPFGTSLAEQLMSLSQSDQQKDSVHHDVESGGTESLSDYSGASVMVRVRMLVFGIRKFSCVIVIWNFLFFILMVFVFGS